MNEKKEMRVRRIENGTVIDHIPAGNALRVLNILGIDGKREVTVTVGMYVDSDTMEKKDIVKIEDWELASKEIDKISLIAPKATYNIIRDFQVFSKHTVTVPEILEGIIKCDNPSCVSNKDEPVESRAVVVSVNPMQIKCYYCGRFIDKIHKQILRP